MNEPTGDQCALHALVCGIIDCMTRVDYLEIGVQEGFGFERVAAKPNVRLVVGIDTWGGNYGGTGRRSPDHVIRRLGGGMDKAILLTGNSPDVLRHMNHQFDVILIDGDHSLEGCRNDLNACLHLLKPSSILIVDDIFHVSHRYLEQLCEDWARDHGFKVAKHAVACGVAELRKA